MTYYGINYDSSIQHHGIKGMKWGIRRFQNRDGSLTELGKERLGYKAYDRYSTDTTIPKGTKATRVLKFSDEWWYKEQKGEEAAKKYAQTIVNKDMANPYAYVSVDNLKNSGRINGTKFYARSFSEDLCDPDEIRVYDFKTKDDMKVASGKKVMDEILKNVDKKTMESVLNSLYPSMHQISMMYTRNENDLFTKVNDKFREMGYDAVEDVNDLNTDMPVIVLNKEKLGKAVKVEDGRSFIEREFGFKYKD